MIMTRAEELQKTIEYLRDFVFKMEARPDGEALRENTERLRAEIRKLEERRDALQPGTDQDPK